MNRDDFMDLSADLVDHSDQETSLSRFDENLGSLEISSVDLDVNLQLAFIIKDIINHAHFIERCGAVQDERKAKEKTRARIQTVAA